MKAGTGAGVQLGFNGLRFPKCVDAALARALELAPNNCNAHYYWAAYLSHFKERHSEAIESVQRALEINPNHAAASKLQQKLRIL